ncbi:hypothetical protein SPWS13_2394 [Shewanella putrefaciens]|nr:hypothetical protein SPWS13_2394 [Shewanella putrefaciens]
MIFGMNYLQFALSSSPLFLPHKNNPICILGWMIDASIGFQ